MIVSYMLRAIKVAYSYSPRFYCNSSKSYINEGSLQQADFEEKLPRIATPFFLIRTLFKFSTLYIDDKPQKKPSTISKANLSRDLSLKNLQHL